MCVVSLRISVWCQSGRIDKARVEIRMIDVMLKTNKYSAFMPRHYLKIF